MAIRKTILSYTRALCASLDGIVLQAWNLAVMHFETQGFISNGSPAWKSYWLPLWWHFGYGGWTFFTLSICSNCCSSLMHTKFRNVVSRIKKSHASYKICFSGYFGSRFPWQPPESYMFCILFDASCRSGWKHDCRQSIFSCSKTFLALLLITIHLGS